MKYLKKLKSIQLNDFAEKKLRQAKALFAMPPRHGVAIVAVAAIAATAIAGYDYIKESHYRSIRISLNYDGAQYGLTPSQGRFDINQIKSDEVIAAAIEKTGDPKLTVENVRPRITIDASMPKSSVDKTIATISNGGKYSYTPAEFEIYYSQKDKLGKNYTVDFLSALAESYREYFNSTYSDKNIVLKIEDGDYQNQDYDEICGILTDKTNSMINYLGQQQEKGVNFVSDDTGYRYSELITSLSNLRDVHIEKLTAYVKQNHVTKDKHMFLNKTKHLLDIEQRNYNHLNGASVISNESIKIYDARISGVAFVPTVDESNEFYMSRTKTGIDNLSNMSYQNGQSAAELKKTMDEYQKSYNGFAWAPDVTDEMRSTADGMIAGIEESLKNISDLAVRTDDEFINKKNNNYLAVSKPKAYSLSVTAWVKNIIRFLIVFFVIFKGLKAFTDMMRKWILKERKENESQAD